MLTILAPIIAAVIPVLDMLHDLYVQAQLVPVDAVLLDKKQYLALLDQAIKLQQFARQSYRFLKLVQDNSVIPYLKATAELEMAQLLEFSTSIELPELPIISTTIQLRGE